MAFAKIVMANRFNMEVALTFTSYGAIYLSTEASKVIDGRYDIYEDEEKGLLKMQEAEHGDITPRKLPKKGDERYMFSRTFLYNYIKNKYNMPATFRLLGEVVEDGIVFNLKTPQQGQLEEVQTEAFSEQD